VLPGGRALAYDLYMSDRNVDLARQGMDAFNRRDLKAYLALMDPGVELTPYEVWVQGGRPYLGHAGVESWWKESLQVLPDLIVEPHEVRDLGDKTYVEGRLLGKGAESGAAVQRTLYAGIHWRNGKQVWWCSFATEQEALDALVRRG
jgi:ketosteroid isomerase-like protein